MVCVAVVKPAFCFEVEPPSPLESDRETLRLAMRV